MDTTNTIIYILYITNGLATDDRRLHYNVYFDKNSNFITLGILSKKFLS